MPLVCVEQVVLNRTTLHRDLEVDHVLAIELLATHQLDRVSLGFVVQERAVEVGAVLGEVGCGPGHRLRRFDAQHRIDDPGGRAVEGLYGLTRRAWSSPGG